MQTSVSPPPSERLSSDRKVHMNTPDQTTVGLPAFPTLLSAEGDFLILGGSMHIHVVNNTTKHRAIDDRRRKRSMSQRKGKKVELKGEICCTHKEETKTKIYSFGLKFQRRD